MLTNILKKAWKQLTNQQARKPPSPVRNVQGGEANTAKVWAVIHLFQAASWTEQFLCKIAS